MDCEEILENETIPTKKLKRFSAGEFRKQLNSDNKLIVLQDFLQLIKNESGQDYILQYLEKSGNCVELFQIMENNSDVSPVLIFEIVNKILLQINAKLPQFYSAAQEACRYFLNNYITLINKMLGLSSTMKQRLVTLKLLTTIVTFNAVLAKDVLVNVGFHQTNLELLTKIADKNEVRNAFIHFLVAFLVDGNYPTLAVLLEKKGLLTSIIDGLKFDEADIVCLVLTAMKNHILENGKVSKTVKMTIFSTPVVKQIVNLYNWKGPDGFQAQKNNKILIVNELEKSKVNESVHNFLIILCTSHKFGVIFRDFTVGLGRKHQNSLMYTVLDSLDRPWEHSYAGELVIKICGACPDLTKTVWLNLKGFLEPRLTDKWLNAMNFAGKLLDELQPSCVEFCVKELNVHQINQIINVLIIPLPVLKTIIPENNLSNNQFIKYNILQFLLKILKSVKNYLNALIWINGENYNKLSNCLNNQIYKNFPSCKFILNDWQNENSDENFNNSVIDYLNVSFDLFDFYKQFSPLHLDDLNNFNIEEFLLKIQQLNEDSLKLGTLQMKIIEFFLNFEQSLFSPKNSLFKLVMDLGLHFYYENPNLNVLHILNLLLKNTNVFQCENHVNFCINGVLNLKKFDSNISEFIVDNIKLALEKETNFIEVLNDLNVSKSAKIYLEFVVLNLFHTRNTIFNNFQILPENLQNYIANWSETITILTKIKGQLQIFHQFSTAFFRADFDKFLSENETLSLYPDCHLNLLQMTIFYLTNFDFEELHLNNSELFIKYLTENSLDDRYFETIFYQSVFIKKFNLFESNLSTKFIVNTFKVLGNVPEKYYCPYRERIVNFIGKITRKPEKYQNFNSEILNVINLNFKQTCEVLKMIPDLSKVKTVTIFYELIIYCLNNLLDDEHAEFSNKIIINIVNYLTNLLINQINESISFSQVFHKFIQKFQLHIRNVDLNLINALMNFNEYNKEIVLLCGYLLQSNNEFLNCLQENLDKICEKKSVLLHLLNVVYKNCNDAILENIFNKFKANILKALQKPQKALHFRNYYKSVGYLIEKFMEFDDCKMYLEKVQKFETTEIFHVYLLKKICDKFMKKSHSGNVITTFIHLHMTLFKSKNKPELNSVLLEISTIFNDFLNEFSKKIDFTPKTEIFKSFYMYSLKYGISGEFILIKNLHKLIQICEINEFDIKSILDMLLSHSDFFEVILNDFNDGKLELLSLFLVLCIKCPKFMERNHIPLLLSAYRATMTQSDQILYELFKMYEKSANNTNFFQFKPFLWGPAAANHYSIRSDVQKNLWRQPKMGDILDILQDDYVNSTIINFPLKTKLNSLEKIKLDPEIARKTYDLRFLLPLFSQLLSSEMPVQTYRFSKSGALSLTILGFCSEDKETRLAASYVLLRFYSHLESKQTGKDNLMWIRFIEALSIGISVLNDLKLNCFAGIYLARMALILTQPNHVMYVPLTQYLLAKSSLDFSTIPELYTFLHSCEVNFHEHRLFILQVIRDGLRTNKDFIIFLYSMGFKLISELCSSSLCDLETKLIILDIFNCCCRFGVKILGGNHSFFVQIFNLILVNYKKDKDSVFILEKLKEISDNLNRFNEK